MRRLWPAGGYLLEVIAADEPHVQAAINSFVRAELGAQPVEGCQLGRAQFLLAPGGASLSTVFRALERSKKELQVWLATNSNRETAESAPLSACLLN